MDRRPTLLQLLLLPVKHIDCHSNCMFSIFTASSISGVAGDETWRQTISAEKSFA